ncbi:MAG: FIST C-terminal domain-containing protein [Bradyrhizobium sp.]|uniref:FIST signal transduction protein n=1 Tax=Bradyrhizobium sp. TaxID=376 RepID=UPI00239F1DE1|nr:FIST N-terminal domain-containing protein [Bradyrhizobium sp.]MDE2601196.1 FIST C-terminal domain-containing protein [Bradyrhizobium sp.]
MRLQRFSLARSDLSKLKVGATRPATELVLYFGSRAGITSEKPFARLKTAFPDATIVGCSTGGQIRADELIDDDIEVVAISFESTRIGLASEVLASVEESLGCGRRIGERLKGADLAGILVLADGLNVNGGDLVAGITGVVGPEVPLIGGLADGADFVETLVGADCAPRSRLVAAIGFYGDAVRFGHGSAGGWDVFGSWRTITRSRKNVLFQLDGEPALDLYERYLGDEAKGLPGTGLRFPLQVMDPENPDRKIIRTILSMDRDQRSLTFAGDVPEGWQARLMRGVFDRLVLGARDAAHQAKCGTVVEDSSGERLALLVSCIGRRVLMGQRISEEIAASLAELGEDFAPFGFYSYGEISPQADSRTCELHNQTMTITTIVETAAV